MKKSLTSFLKNFSLPLVVFLASFLIFNTVFAIGTADVGIDQVGNDLVLGSGSPVQTVIKIIQVFLGLLGLVAVVIIMYGGFLWTTSGGSEEKITKAKKILRNAVICIIIILSSWGITAYILSVVISATGGTGFSPAANNGSVQNLSLGTMGSCSIESVFPAPEAS